MKEPPAPSAIRRRRVAFGLTALDLADMAGISEAEVLTLERGTLSALPPGAWDAICSALKLGPSNANNPPAPLCGPRRRGRHDGATVEAPAGPRPPPASAAPWWLQLRLQRLRLGMSRKEAHSHSRVSVRRIACLEAGSLPTTTEQLDDYRRLACALSVDPPELPVLPIASANLWSVGARVERSAQAAANLAAASPPQSPARLLIQARLANGWSRQRAASVYGTHCQPLDIEAAESAQAWPLWESDTFARLVDLWRVKRPYAVVSGHSAEAQEGLRTIAERLTALASRWDLDREQVCVVAEISPQSLDAVLTCDASAPGQAYWRAVARLTNCGFGLVEGLSLGSGCLMGERAKEGEK